MAIKSGFFNSHNGDRKYSAEDFSNLFNGIFQDGILRGVGGELKCTSAGGNRINVAPGRAWFGGIWVDNSSTYVVDCGPAESVLNRWDTIVLEIDKRASNRSASIKVIKGPPSSSSPTYPSVTNNGDLIQKKLAIIYRVKGASSISQSGIISMVGTSDTPYAKSLSSIHDAVVPSSFPSLSGLGSSTDKVVVGRGSGDAHIINASELIFPVLAEGNISNRNRLFRGKYLGSYVTSSQKETIRNGQFNDLYIGDYWTINGNNWRIAHFDYFYGYGGTREGNSGQVTTKVTNHHVILVPDNTLRRGFLHNSEYTDSGYLGFTGRQANGIVGLSFSDTQSALGLSNLVKFPVVFVSSASQGYATSAYIQDSYMEPLNEQLVFGFNVNGIRAQQSSSFAHVYTFNHSQLALFAMSNKFIPSSDGVSYWTTDITNRSAMMYIRPDGRTGMGSPAHNQCGIRPFVAYGGVS